MGDTNNLTVVSGFETPKVGTIWIISESDAVSLELHSFMLYSGLSHRED